MHQAAIITICAIVTVLVGMSNGLRAALNVFIQANSFEISWANEWSAQELSSLLLSLLLLLLCMIEGCVHGRPPSVSRYKGSCDPLRRGSWRQNVCVMESIMTKCPWSYVCRHSFVSESMNHDRVTSRTASQSNANVRIPNQKVQEVRVLDRAKWISKTGTYCWPYKLYKLKFSNTKSYHNRNAKQNEEKLILGKMVHILNRFFDIWPNWYSMVPTR